MWPVMTLTLLLQLTDDEQLYAEAPVIQVATAQQQAPVLPAEEKSAVAWPEEAGAIG